MLVWLSFSDLRLVNSPRANAESSVIAVALRSSSVMSLAASLRMARLSSLKSLR